MVFASFSGAIGPVSAACRGLRLRLKGPGGFYNMGNALGLGLGLALQIKSGAGGTGWNAVAAFFVGSPTAICLTSANLIFFWSGEMYHRAWSHGAPPDAVLNRRGDILSGYGAIFLGFGLILLGPPVLALFSGALHACGKFGSALQSEFRIWPAIWPATWPDPFRSAVLASRVPAVIAAGLGLARWQAGVPLSDLLALLGLLGSYGLWAIADLKLLRG